MAVRVFSLRGFIVEQRQLFFSESSIDWESIARGFDTILSFDGTLEEVDFRSWGGEGGDR